MNSSDPIEAPKFKIIQLNKGNEEVSPGINVFPKEKFVKTECSESG